MAKSNCIRCGKERFDFEISDLNVDGNELWFVQCSHCGGVVGVVEINHDFFDDRANLRKFALHSTNTNFVLLGKLF